MKLSNQAIGALMMALQKSLLEQSDIVPTLQEMELLTNPDDPTGTTLVVTNPPVVSLEGTTLVEATEELNFEGGTGNEN
tara:strand:+ start:216 stop:452 length:237 start_codon:yes stop_codon:yes gene_type:complete